MHISCIDLLRRDPLIVYSHHYSFRKGFETALPRAKIPPCVRAAGGVLDLRIQTGFLSPIMYSTGFDPGIIVLPCKDRNARAWLAQA